MCVTVTFVRIRANASTQISKEPNGITKWNRCVRRALAEKVTVRNNDEEKDSDKQRNWEKESQGSVAMEMTYCQLPIVDTGGIIGFEMKVEEGPLVKSRVNKLSLLSPIWPLNKSAMFALSHVCLLPRERLIFSSERQGQAYRRTATRLNSLICGLSREGLCLWVPTWAKQPSSSASGQKLGAKYYYSTKYDRREDKRSEKSFKRP